MCGNFQITLNMGREKLGLQNQDNFKTNFGTKILELATVSPDIPELTTIWRHLSRQSGGKPPKISITFTFMGRKILLHICVKDGYWASKPMSATLALLSNLKYCAILRNTYIVRFLAIWPKYAEKKVFQIWSSCIPFESS